MRIHVTANGKPTSVSIDETLMDYLGAYAVQDTPKRHTDAKRQFNLAKQMIQTLVRESADLPEKNLSQYVQKLVVRTIAAPELTPILEARGERYAPPTLEEKAEARRVVLRSLGMMGQ